MKACLFLVFLPCIALSQDPAVTYPTPPANSIAGKLSCGIRLFTADSVQTWCFYFDTPSSTPALVHNTIAHIQDGDSTTLGFSRCEVPLDGTGNCPGQLDQVLWLVQRVQPGHSTTYQITTSQEAWKKGILGMLQIPDAPDLTGKICGMCCFEGNMPFPRPWYITEVILVANCAQ